MDSKQRDSLFPSAKVFCNAQLLDALQNSPYHTFDDSKTLVDLELKLEPDQVLQLFSALPANPSRDEYESFMKRCFKTLDDSLRSFVRKSTPVDCSDALPTFIDDLQNPKDELVAFVSDLKERWGELCREIILRGDSKLTTYSSLIPLPFPFFVPGGRFRECFYWDTLWIVKGLVACGMLQSAKGAVRNLLYLVDHIGFVPNGNRVYFLNRSQPPLLTEATKVVHDALHDATERVKWLREVVPTLDKEYAWFRENRSAASLDMKGSYSGISLSVYNVNTSDPRPESFKEDCASLGRRLQTSFRAYEEDPHTSLYRNLASAAESGWDFSSRWLSDEDEARLESIQTCRIVPVCLNSILLKAEKDLSSFHSKLGNQVRESSGAPNVESDDFGTGAGSIAQNHMEQASYYKSLAKKRELDMQRFCWNREEGFWYDFNLHSGCRTSTLSCAGMMPIWAACGEETWTLSDAKRFVDFVLFRSGLLQPDGLLSCTTETSKEQWDFPNSWPPLIDFAVDALQRLGNKFPECGGKHAAEVIAGSFLETAFRGWFKDNDMHEKYDARVRSGHRGTGGEYVPQTGFGWTNGSVLWLLRDFAHALNSKVADQQK